MRILFLIPKRLPTQSRKIGKKREKCVPNIDSKMLASRQSVLINDHLKNSILISILLRRFFFRLDLKL